MNATFKNIFGVVENVTLAAISLIGILLISVLLSIGFIVNAEKAMQYLDVNGLIAQEEFIDLVSITPVKNELKALREENERLSKEVRTVVAENQSLKVQKQAIEIQNNQLVSKLDNALVSEGSVRELMQNRVVVPVVAAVQPVKQKVVEFANSVRSSWQ